MSEQKTRQTVQRYVTDRFVAHALAAELIHNRVQFSIAPSAVSEKYAFEMHDVVDVDSLNDLIQLLETDPSVIFHFDGPEEYGTFSVSHNGWGADLSVNGRDVGSIDVFKDADGEESVPAFIFDDPNENGEVIAKVAVDGPKDSDSITVIVNGDFSGPTPSGHPRAIHSDGRDHVFQFLGADAKS